MASHEDVQATRVKSDCETLVACFEFLGFLLSSVVVPDAHGVVRRTSCDQLLTDADVKTSDLFAMEHIHQWSEDGVDLFGFANQVKV